MNPRLVPAAFAAAVIVASFGSTQAVAGGGISYSGQGNVNIAGNGGNYQVPVLYSATPTVCNPCGGAFYQPQSWHHGSWNQPSWGGPAYAAPISMGSAMAASLVGGIANTQQTGGSVTGGNVYIGGAGAAAASGGSWGWGHHGGGSAPTATATTTAEVNYSNTNQTTNTTTNNITGSFNTTINTTVNKTYNIDNSSNTTFNFYVLGNSNAVNTGSGAAVVSGSGNNVGNTNGSLHEGRNRHNGIWNLASGN